MDGLGRRDRPEDRAERGPRPGLVDALLRFAGCRRISQPYANSTWESGQASLSGGFQEASAWPGRAVDGFRGQVGVPCGVFENDLDGLLAGSFNATRAVSWALVHRSAAVYVGGAPADAPRYKAVPSAPEGQLDERGRAGVRQGHRGDPRRRERCVATRSQSDLGDPHRGPRGPRGFRGPLGRTRPDHPARGRSDSPRTGPRPHSGQCLHPHHPKPRKVNVQPPATHSP